MVEKSDKGLDKSEERRKRILDATLTCYVKYGWSGTNMSVIARHVRMTRGMIQYYFPTLEAVLHASVSHLNNEWRKKYFSYVEHESSTTDRLEVGISALWRLMQDPLHIARQELIAAARSNEALRTLLLEEANFDEASTLETAKQTYPDLARTNETTFRQTLDYTVVFLEGLSRHQFSEDGTGRTQALLDMLKKNLTSYWHEQGIEFQQSESSEPLLTDSVPQNAPAKLPDTLDASKRDRALALVLEAASILSGERDKPLSSDQTE